MQLLAVLENRVLIAAVLAWFIAQVLKVVLVFWKEKRIDFSRMVGSGGMQDWILSCLPLQPQLPW